MPNTGEITNQKSLLDTYRRTLANQLRQLAAAGSAHAHPSLLSGIQEARDEIWRIKDILRGWCIPVEDYPSDDDSSQVRRARVFISYKRDLRPDQELAHAVLEALSPHHDVFIDRLMPVGTKWAERIKSEICRSDVLITFLSPLALASEMVNLEIATAYEFANSQNGRPKILPVRLNYYTPFQYPLSEYLNQLQWALWKNHSDTQRIINELIIAIAGGKLSLDNNRLEEPYEIARDTWVQPQPVAQPLDLPEGTMDPESRFYLSRPTDNLALRAIARQGVTITIKGPRQMGKSSLLIRTIDAARRSGKRTVMLDFQLFDKTVLQEPEQFFRDFCTWLSDELEIPSQVEEYWAIKLGNAQRCTRYMGRYVLPMVHTPLVLALDEVETIFDTSFRSDFFGMLRSWHNKRSTPTEPIWKQLDLALVTSTEPYQLIDNLNQSPFNVGHIIELTDFTPAQIAELNRIHEMPLSAREEQQIGILLRGHPYLTRRAFYLVASQTMTAQALIDNAAEDRGPFGDHLRFHLFRLHDKLELIQGLREVLNQGTCRNDLVYFRLHGAGLVRREQNKVVPRCPLYAAYFQERLHG